MNVLRRFRFRHLVEGEPDAVFGLLRQVERIAEWVPRVERSQLLAREGDVAVFELVFRGAASSLTLEVVFLDDLSIRFTQVDRLEGDGLQGEVHIEAEPAGGGSVVDLRCRLAGWGLLWPSDRRILRETLLQATGALARFVKTPPAAGSASKAAIEVVATRPELRLRLGGREYRLVPETEA